MSARRWLVPLGLVTITSVAAVITAASAALCEASLRVAKRTSGGSAPVALYAGADWRTIRIRASDGIALAGWFVRPRTEQRGRCVVVLHGIGDTRMGSAGFAPLFLARGYNVLLPDSRGHGSSGGDLVTFGVREKYDVLDWVRWMRAEGCTHIYGLGESLDASVLIETVAIDSVFRAIVAECPYLDLRAIAEYRVREHLHVPRWISGVTSKAVVAGGMVYAKCGTDLICGKPPRSRRWRSRKHRFSNPRE